MEIEKTVFISYRRTNGPWALAIYQDLTQHGFDVFFDYESIPSGDFEQVIIGNIKARAHFLCLLTPSSLERCNEPNDWLRREIEVALDEKRNIVPLFLEGFSFATPVLSQYLTGKLALLRKYNGINVPADYFPEAMNRLRQKYLNTPLNAILHPMSNEVQKVVADQQLAASQAIQVNQNVLTAQEWFEQGKKEFYAQQYDKAFSSFTRAINLNANYGDAYNARGTIREIQGDLKGAIEQYDQAIRIEPGLGKAYINRANLHYNQNNFADAIRDYTIAILLGYEVPLAYKYRGMAHQNNGNIDDAINDYNKALQLTPVDEQIYFERGMLRGRKGDLEGQILDLTSSLNINPTNAYTYYQRGLARYRFGDIDGAIQDCGQSIDLAPYYADPYGTRGSAWYSKGEYYAAANDYQAYYDLGGQDEILRPYLEYAKAQIAG